MSITLHYFRKIAFFKKYELRLSENLYQICITSPLNEETPTRDYKDSLAEVLAPQMLSSWLETVARTANEICRDAGAKYEKGGYCGRIVTPTRKSMECLILAIDMHIGDAPDLARQVLASYRLKMRVDLANNG